jgi:hypothetical protein
VPYLILQPLSKMPSSTALPGTARPATSHYHPPEAGYVSILIFNDVSTLPYTGAGQPRRRRPANVQSRLQKYTYRDFAFCLTGPPAGTALTVSLRLPFIAPSHATH